MAHLLKTRVATPTDTGVGLIDRKFTPSPVPAAVASKKGATDAEAFADMDAVFKGLDILGTGKLDDVAFKVALIQMGVSLPEKEIEDIFEQLDVDDTGFIEYAQFLKFMKLGKIPSTLLNRVKKSGAAPRKSIFFGGGAMAMGLAAGMKSSAAGAPALLSLSEIDKIQAEREFMEESSDEELDPERQRMVNRAIIVIKKSFVKKLPREDVEKFLMDKGMDYDDIDLAFKITRKKAMSTTEKVQSLKGELLKKSREIDELKEMNRHLTRQMTEDSRDVELMRELLGVTIDLLETHYVKKYDDEDIPEAVAAELTKKITELTAMKKSTIDDDEVEVLARDVDALEQCRRNVAEKQLFHAFLAFSCLPESRREGLPNTTAFLEKYGPSGGYDAGDEEDA
jgi:hypothetical protein